MADGVLDCLVRGGIRHFFGIPGVHNLSLWEAARRRTDIHLMGVRHEQAAVYAADSYARATGRPAAALTTTGPGAANAAAAMGEAAASFSPVILVATEVSGRGEDERGSFGRVHGSPDQAAIFEPLAKAVFRPRNADQVVNDVSTLVERASSPPQGPVYIDIPADLLDAPAAAAPEVIPPGPLSDPDTVQRGARRLAEMLGGSARPMLWVGGGATSPEAATVVQALAERMGAPVVTTFAGRGVIAEPHPSWIGLPIHEPEVTDLLGRSDLLVGLGSAFDGMNTRNWNLPFPDTLADVNVQRSHLVEEHVTHEWIEGDVAAICTATMSALEEADAPRVPVWDDLPGLRKRAWERIERDDMDPAAMGLLRGANKALSEGALVVADMAISGYWVAGYAEPREARQLSYPVGWGTLGFAASASIGAGVAARESDGSVVVISGDGGFLMGVGELATAREHELPITYVVTDDGAYGMIKYDQERLGHGVFGVDMVSPDFVALAQSFGIPAQAVDAGDPGAIANAIWPGGSRPPGPKLVLIRAALRPPRTTSPRWRDDVA